MKAKQPSDDREVVVASGLVASQAFRHGLRIWEWSEVGCGTLGCGGLPPMRDDAAHGWGTPAVVVGIKEGVGGPPVMSGARLVLLG